LHEAAVRVVLGRELQLAALRLRSRAFKELEIVVLRHELAPAYPSPPPRCVD
jgi:hypothetical protein